MILEPILAQLLAYKNRKPAEADFLPAGTIGYQGIAGDAMPTKTRIPPTMTTSTPMDLG